MTPGIVFRGSSTLWMTTATKNDQVGYDYLLSGRNVRLLDPRSIIGTLANFLPIITAISSAKPVPNFLMGLQEDFGL